MNLFQSWPPVRTLLFPFFFHWTPTSQWPKKRFWMCIIPQIDVCELPPLLLSSFCNYNAIKCDNDFIKTSSYKWTKLLYLRIKKDKQKVYVDFNLIWRFRHSEGSKAQIFYSLTETILTSSSSPSSGRMSGLPPFCFFLLFPLELTFVKKQPHQVLFTKLNSLLPLHLWLTKLHPFTADDFLPTSQSGSWPLAPDGLTVFTEAGSFAFQTAFAQNFFASFTINFLTNRLCLELQWKLKKMVTKLDHLFPSKKYSKLTCEVQPHCVLLWHVQTWFFNTKL